MNAFYVFIGGGLGSLVRFAIGLFIGNFTSTTFPVATLISNSISCAILAVITVVFSTKMSDSSWMQPLILIGFCGGFSTFSTFSAETVALIQSGNVFYAFLNVLVSVSFGMGIIYYLFATVK